MIRLDWQSGPVTSFKLYIGGILRGNLRVLSTSPYLVDSVRLGPLAGLTAAMSGTEYFDEFLSTRYLMFP